MAQTLGLIKVNWRGQDIVVDKGGKVKLGGLKANPHVMGQQVDFSNEFEMSEVSVTTRLAAGSSLNALWAPGPGPLIVLCDTGQTYSHDAAILTNMPEFTAGEGGKIPMKWNCGQMTEVIA